MFSCACHQSQTPNLSGKGWHWTEENGGLNQSLLDCPSKLQATSAQSNVLTSFRLQNQDTRLTAKRKQADTWAKGAFLLPSVRCWFCNQSGSFIFNCRTKVLQRHNCSVETLLIGLISNTTTIYGAEKHSIMKSYSEKLWTKYSFYKKHFLIKYATAPETAHHIQMKRLVLRSLGAHHLPISSGPSQRCYSPLRKCIWQIKNGDFSKLLSHRPHTLNHSEPVPRNKVSRDTLSAALRSMWYATDALRYSMQITMMYKFSTRIRSSTVDLQNVYASPVKCRFSKHTA